MAVPLTIGIHTFRTLNDPLFGNLRVKSGSSRGRGARRIQNRANGPSLGSCTGSDDGDGPTDGGSAHTSAAHAAGSPQCADSDRTDRPETGRAPISGNAEVPRPVDPPLFPSNGFDFVKEVNAKKQLVEVVTSLLEVPEPKVKLQLTQQLLRIAYARDSRPAPEKRRRYVNDLPQAVLY
jgi:hypothetical protein